MRRWWPRPSAADRAVFDRRFPRSFRPALTAESSYRHVLALWPDLNTTSGMVHTSLAEVLLAQDREVTDAMDLLEQAVPHLRFNSQIFRWNLALARTADRLGDLETRRHAARRALELAEQGPQLSRHPDVGLARPDSATLEFLRRLAN